MTDIDKIKVEIEWRLERCELVEKDAHNFNADNLKLICSQVKLAYQSLLDFINSLPKEPVSEDLEEVNQKQKDLIYPLPLEDDFDDPCFSLSSDNKSKRIGFDKGFKIGAEWQKERMIIKVCKWFNDNACNYFGHMPAYPFIDDLKQAMKDE